MQGDGGQGHPLLAATLTRDPLGVSVITAITYAAWLVVGLPAGVVVDRWPRRFTMVVTDLARAALLGGLAALVLAHGANLVLLAVVVLLTGAAACFFDPAAQAAIPSIVAREPPRFAVANNRLWMPDVLGRSLVGPPAGAAFFAIGTSIPFGANAFTFIASALLLGGLGPMGVRPLTAGHPPIRESLREGMGFLWGIVTYAL